MTGSTTPVSSLNIQREAFIDANNVLFLYLCVLLTGNTICEIPTDFMTTPSQ